MVVAMAAYALRDSAKKYWYLRELETVSVQRADSVISKLLELGESAGIEKWCFEKLRSDALVHNSESGL